MLEASGHSVTSAGSAAEAIAAFAPGRYDVVLTNVGMGEVNGWELTERIRALDGRVPVVFITGWGLQEAEQERLRTLKIQQCLFKPVHPAQLDAAVQDA